MCFLILLIVLLLMLLLLMRRSMQCYRRRTKLFCRGFVLWEDPRRHLSLGGAGLLPAKNVCFFCFTSCGRITFARACAYSETPCSGDLVGFGEHYYVRNTALHREFKLDTIQETVSKFQ